MGLKRINRRWDELARSDPFWAIVSDPAKRGNRWDAEEFFRNGREQIEQTLGRLEELGCLPEPGRALDFGCGAGRLTQAMAAHFEEAHGVDASPTMVELARTHNPHGARCTYHHVDRPPLPFPDGRFDFVLSVLTLQHIPPRPARRYIAELLRVLAPRGTLVFQEAADPILPGESHTAWERFRHRIKRLLPRPLFDALRSIHLSLRPPDTFEMHGIPRRQVEALIRRGGGRPVHVEENRSAGEGWTSYRYYVVK